MLRPTDDTKPNVDPPYGSKSITPVPSIHAAVRHSKSSCLRTPRLIRRTRHSGIKARGNKESTHDASDSRRDGLYVENP